MRVVSLAVCFLFLPGISGCASDDDRAPAADAGEMASAAKTSASTGANEAPMPGEGEVVWADEAFLAAAGVKEGKDVIYLPTPPMVVDKMIEMAQIKADELVYDLGTGDGRIAIAAAQQIGCKVVGYEIDADLARQARENVRKAGLEHLVTIKEQDILETDFSEVDVVLMYLNSQLNVMLIPQFQKMKAGSRIVSHDWGMNGLLENETVIENFMSKVPDFVNLHTLYRWDAPIVVKESAQ
jgi:predicted O-methyltransferase YrrM